MVQKTDRKYVSIVDGWLQVNKKERERKFCISLENIGDISGLMTVSK